MDRAVFHGWATASKGELLRVSHRRCTSTFYMLTSWPITDEEAFVGRGLGLYHLACVYNLYSESIAVKILVDPRGWAKKGLWSSQWKDGRDPDLGSWLPRAVALGSLCYNFGRHPRQLPIGVVPGTVQLCTPLGSDLNTAFWQSHSQLPQCLLGRPKN